MAHLYGPAVRCKPDVSDLEIVGFAHLYSALRREHLAPRPPWISAHIRSHSRQGPGRPDVPPDHGCDGGTVSPFPQSNSQTSAGIPASGCSLSDLLLILPRKTPSVPLTPLLAQYEFRNCVLAPEPSERSSPAYWRARPSERYNAGVGPQP